MEVLGRYQLLHRIGVGGMAEVFLARAIGEGNFSRTVVVKRMLPQIAEDKAAVEMFLDEARLGSVLHHPNIVPVLDLGRIGTDYFMVMDYVEGVNLGTLEHRSKFLEMRIPEVHAAWIVARAAEGLHAAHGAVHPETGAALSVVHRDVSPSNILVSRGGEVRVADFGVARSTAQESHTSAGVLKGKITYMSPEQVLCGPLDGRSDIYSLGIVLWQLLSGRRRFDRDSNELRIMQAVMHEAVPPLLSVNPTVDPELARVVAKMTAREARARYQTMREVARELDRFTVKKGHLGKADLEQWFLDHPTLCAPAEAAPAELASPLASANRPTKSDPVKTLARREDSRTVAPQVAPQLSEESRANWERLAGRRVMQSPETTSSLVNGEAVVLATASQRLHTLNETATFIWQRADGERTLQQIADELFYAFQVEQDAACEEVMAFVEEAVAQGFLVFTA